MVEPYYEHGGITIYHGSAYDVVNDIGLKKDSCVVISDPPYGITSHGWDHSADVIQLIPKALGWVITSSLGYTYMLINKHQDILSYDMVWDKNGSCNRLHCSNRPGMSHENILVFGRPPYNPLMIRRTASEYQRIGKTRRTSLGWEKQITSVLTVPVVNNYQERLHPTQKPVGLFSILVRMFSSKDHLVIDPFVGSGTTLLAAKMHNRKAIGIELNERYCEIAAKRLSQEVLPF